PRLVSATAVRSRATADRLLATRLTTKNANSAIQLCGSAMTNAPTGGRKKKLKASIATIDVVTATHSRDVAATSRTTIRYPSATVVEFERLGHHHSRRVIRAIPMNPRRRWRTSAEIAMRAS